jgi:hypothetical protein
MGTLARIHTMGLASFTAQAQTQQRALLKEGLAEARCRQAQGERLPAERLYSLDWSIHKGRYSDVYLELCTLGEG